MAHHLFTSESVTEGHPDKICDQISDAILDAILAQDPNGRVACECTVTTGVVNVMGEITTDCYVDIPKVVRQTVREIGYDRAKYGFDCETCAVITNIDEQSADIALGVDQSLESKETGDSALDNGAGDQGMMFGFACDETPELMPLPISLAHKLAKRLTAVRKQGLVDYLRPDGKTQVTVEYDEQNRPVRVHTVVLSTQHAPEVDMAQLRKDMIELVIRPTIPAELLDDDTRYLINPTTLKTVFKQVYGNSLAAHMKEHRMEKAASLLRETELSVAEIAGQVGYESQSKFTAAFKEQFGKLPKEYRRI